jgi:hypothetical protein
LGKRPAAWRLLAKQKIDARMTQMRQINAAQPKEKSVNIRRIRVIREAKLPRF